MEEIDIIENLINLDSKAIEISEKRKEQLLDLTNQYKEEELKIIKNYKKQIEEKTRYIVQKMEQETEQEVNQLRLENKILLEDMQKKFEKNLKGIIDEIIKRIFEINRENYG
ncbi:MAG: hypothetical protein PHI72_03685 [Atribacterota bacterium]|nr:hypothetical protein [Atribacterota bacterium]MDD4895436.1 hypothetical protein [Atribacterota bacterium]MDD5636816.1 hypothetical protein [Atribacterota bacterium]